MSPTTYDFKYYQGDSFPFLIRPGAKSGEPFDLSGYSATLDIAERRGNSSTFRIRLVPVVDSVENTILCNIPPATGALLSSGTTYYYDVTITKGALVYTLLTGTITVTDAVFGV